MYVYPYFILSTIHNLWYENQLHFVKHYNKYRHSQTKLHNLYCLILKWEYNHDNLVNQFDYLELPCQWLGMFEYLNLNKKKIDKTRSIQRTQTPPRLSPMTCDVDLMTRSRTLKLSKIMLRFDKFSLIIHFVKPCLYLSS